MGQEARSGFGENPLKDTKNEEKTLSSKSMHSQTLARHTDETQELASDQSENKESILPHF